MDVPKYTEEDVEIVVAMLLDIDRRLEERKVQERERKQAEEQLHREKARFRLREPYASLIRQIAEMLGVPSPASATADEINELTETVQYYAELQERNNQALEALFKIQAELFKMNSQLFKEAERRRDQAKEEERKYGVLAQMEGAPLVPAASPAMSSEDVERLFNLQYLFSQISPWYEDACFIVDGYNVIGRVPRYNYRVQVARLGECRDRLIHDLDYLKSQIEGDWCVVFDTVHAYEEAEQCGIRVVFPHGNRISSKESGDDRVVAEAERLVAEKRKVFVITNDAELSARSADVGATTLAVGEVFRY
jgi:predicted RNA-binding protein with PIN domain